MKKVLDLPPDGAESLARDDHPDAVLLDPRVTIPPEEVWLHRNPVALAEVRRGLEEAREGKARKAGPFASSSSSRRDRSGGA